MKLRVIGKFKFLGIESSTNFKTGEIYNFLGLLQGIESIKLFANEKDLEHFKNISVMSDVECELEISIGKEKTYTNILNVKKVG